MTTDDTSTTYGAADVGCFIDGHNGVHGHKMLVDLAIDAGFIVTTGEYAAVGRYDSGEFMDEGDNAPEIMSDVMEDAEGFLNEHAVADGFSFGWSDGEFFLAPDHGDETAWCQSEGADCDEGCQVPS